MWKDSDNSDAVAGDDSYTYVSSSSLLPLLDTVALREHPWGGSLPSGTACKYELRYTV